MTRYEYRERIKELKEQAKLLRQVVKMYQASEYIDGLALDAYKQGMWKCLGIMPTSVEKIVILSEVTAKIDYVNRQYDEHFPVKKDK